MRNLLFGALAWRPGNSHAALAAAVAVKPDVTLLDRGLPADDYLTKPFDIAELLARTRAALRHSLQTDSSVPLPRVEDVNLDRRKVGHIAGDNGHAMDNGCCRYNGITVGAGIWDMKSGITLSDGRVNGQHPPGKCR